jgi:hypothetical protein
VSVGAAVARVKEMEGVVSEESDSALGVVADVPVTRSEALETVVTVSDSGRTVSTGTSFLSLGCGACVCFLCFSTQAAIPPLLH